MWDKYYGDYWKVYLNRFQDRKTKQFIALKPGWTKFKDADDRAKFNHELFLKGEEPDSFLNHYNVKCIWSLTVKSVWERDYLESFMLNWFGDKKDLGFYTSGSTEVREYDQTRVNKWLSKTDDQILNWLKKEKDANIFTL